MPRTVSVKARDLSALGANQTFPYHARRRSRASASAILNWSRLSGRIGALISSKGMSADEPQKSQRWATWVGSKTVIAWQLWHFTDFFSACHPRWSSGMLRNAATRSCSTIAPAPSFSGAIGATVPQNGHTSACFAAFHGASPPQDGQANFELAPTADMRVYA